MTMTALKRIRASKAGQYLLCPGSWRLEQEAPEPTESEEAAEGTLCHKAVGDTPAYLKLEEDQRDLVDAVRALRAKLGTGSMIVEDGHEEMSASGPQAWYFTGTPDFFAVGDDQFTVADWKFGRLGLVEVPVVAQLSVYAYLIFRHLEERGIRLERGKGVAFNPRTHDTLEVSFDRREVDENLETLIKSIEAGAEEFHPQPVACKYCRALPICSAVEKSVEVAVRDKLALTPDRRAARREFRELALDWAERVQAEDRQHLQGGGEIPGWHLQQQSGARRLRDPAEAYDALKAFVTPQEMLGTMKPQITTLEKLIVGKLQARTPELKAKEAKATFHALLGDVLVEEPAFTKIVRDKGGSKA
jgi:CRISPR/Cas system-associated exonuclease Cas4 (RecB family)